MTHEEKIIERLKTEQMLSAEELDCLLATEDTEAVRGLGLRLERRHRRFTENRSISEG